MKAPDKIYCGNNGHGNLSYSSAPFDNATEYVRKDAIPQFEDTVAFQKGVEEGRRLERQDMAWRKDPCACILTNARLVRWTGEQGNLVYKILCPGDMYVEDTEYIPFRQIESLPSM